ncbi:DUF1648 domain-containing protein, partial [Cellulomonas sp. B6]|uniref:DUF1648 domain-containing protein n=1 Tax=Cellulomonas sp. B6 TaxID=1295626 RepID=UPI0016807073
VPLGVLAATVLIARAWAPRLPDPVATHWSGTDVPDGFGSPASLLAVPLVVGGLLAVGLWALAFWLGRDTSTRRVAAGFASGTAAFLSATTLGTLHGQLDLADAADAPGVGPTIGLALGVALVVGVVVALVVPRTPHQPTTAPVDPAAPRADLGATERAAWSSTVTSRAALVAGGVAALTTAGLAIGLRTPAMLLVPAALLALGAAMFVLRVSVDGRGLVARSPLGWPTLHVPLDEVVAARAVSVDPFGEFGGWGYRVGQDGRVGVVLRRGEAIEVERTGGRVNVVTVDDAARAASLLNTLADRARSATAG